MVTGAVESVYQGSRVQKICHELDVYCFNPLWKKDQVELLNELLQSKFEVIVSGVFAYPFDESWLGRKLDEDMIHDLIDLQKKYKINPAGEGGEWESLVINAPFFKKKIEIVDAKKEFENHAGVFKVQEAKLV